MILRTILILTISFFLMACGDDDSNLQDYREAWAGTYEGSKSNRSFDDDMFSTEIEINVELDSDSILIVNGLSVPVTKYGTYDGLYDGNYFVLNFKNDSIKMLTYPDVLGDAIGCYIQGKKS